MPRNTFLLVSALACIAAIVAGVNLAKKINPQTQPLTPTPTPSESTQTYTNTFCGFSLNYPSTLSVMENASGSALLVSNSDKAQSVVMTCQAEIPRAPLPEDKIEALSIPYGKASISANLYHDASQKDGSPIDALIFTNPKNKLDIFIASSPSAIFRTILSSIIILP